MKLPNRLPSRAYLGNLAVKGVCAGIGIGAAFWVFNAMKPQLIWLKPVPQIEAPVEFPTAPVAEAPRAGDKDATTAPSGESVLRMPVDFETPTSQKAAVPEVPLPAPVDPLKAPAQELAPLNPQEVPVSPETVGQYPERKGGDVLVVLLTIDDTYTVVDSEIKVPSFDGLADISTAVGALGKQVTDIYPPIRKGELRKVDYRIHLVDPMVEARARIERAKRIEQGLSPDAPAPFVPPDELLP